MEPEYVAIKSAWKAVTPLRVLFFWLVIPLLIMIGGIIRLKHEKIEFYRDKIIQRSGVFSKHEKESVFVGILSVSIDQSFGGRICGYGDVKVDVVGKWDIDTCGIKDPKALKAYLQTRTVANNSMATTILA